MRSSAYVALSDMSKHLEDDQDITEVDKEVNIVDSKSKAKEICLILIVQSNMKINFISLNFQKEYCKNCNFESKYEKC